MIGALRRESLEYEGHEGRAIHFARGRCTPQPPMRHEPHTTSGGAASVVAIRVLALFILAVVAGCRIPDAEFGRMAKPIGVPALYAATRDCGTPVPWPAIDRAHDEYFDAYWKLRAEVAAPMAMACIDAAGQPSLPSMAQLDELAAKQRSLLPAVSLNAPTRVMMRPSSSGKATCRLRSRGPSPMLLSCQL